MDTSVSTRQLQWATVNFTYKCFLLVVTFRHWVAGLRCRLWVTNYWDGTLWCRFVVRTMRRYRNSVCLPFYSKVLQRAVRFAWRSLTSAILCNICYFYLLWLIVAVDYGSFIYNAMMTSVFGMVGCHCSPAISVIVRWFVYSALSATRVHSRRSRVHCRQRSQWSVTDITR